MLVSPHPG